MSHSFFLGGVGVELRSSKPGAPVDGLALLANQFVIGGAGAHGHKGNSVAEFVTVTLNESAGAFAVPRSTVIRDSATPRATYGKFLNKSFHSRQTVAQRSLAQVCSAAPCRWELDFSTSLDVPKQQMRWCLGTSVVWAHRERPLHIRGGRRLPHGGGAPTSDGDTAACRIGNKRNGLRARDGHRPARRLMIIHFAQVKRQQRTRLCSR